MARPIPPERFSRLVDAATKTFVARGYRLTQMADVAEALGVAKGTLYGYVESKEALFDAAVRFADSQGALPEPSELPWPTPEAGSTVKYVQTRLMEEVRQLVLVTALSAPQTSSRMGDFEAVIRDLLRRMSGSRRALKLVDRCAVDHPQLAAVWFQEGRYGLVGLLAAYLERRSCTGEIRRIPNVQLAARMVLETIALWAIHMPWDPAPRPLAEDEIEDAVVDLLVHAYAKENSP
jgi:AcrR family transcriptional regulator